MTDYRRRQNSQRWHWCPDCKDYPKEEDVLVSHTAPEYGTLCKECEDKEPIEKR
ncbi:MAG: hypothetical protein WCA08_15390 [Desulfoferrobacter sp.]